VKSVVSYLLRVPFVVPLAFVMVACTDAPPPQSPSSDLRDVQVHRADDKPDFVKLERLGDPSVGVAAAYVHGASPAVSTSLAAAALEHLLAAGYTAAVTPTDAAVIVSVSLTAQARIRGTIGAIRAALAAGHAQVRTVNWEAHPKPASRHTPCGIGTSNLVAAAPGHTNTVLAAVGSDAVLTHLQSDYEQTSAWAAGLASDAPLPTQDEFVATIGPDPAELVVGVRTAARQRVLPAARRIGGPDSLLSLLAQSHNGAWQLMSTHGAFIPGGGCLSVQLTARESATALDAARAAHAIQRELRWVLAEEVQDEDPRFNVLDATSAEEAAQRAAWEAVTARNYDASATSSAFVAHRGPNVDVNKWRHLLLAEAEPTPFPQFTRDERGQGRTWALLTNPCPTTVEDTSTAGFSAASILAASRVVPQAQLEAYTSWEHSGLLSWRSTRAPGAEDHIAESLARGILEVLANPAVAALVARDATNNFDRPQWNLALTLATNGHPSWLSQRSTPQSRALFDADALVRAMRRFTRGPLQLAVLTNQGSEQAVRLNTRLAHLLSGVYSQGSECLPADLGQSPAPPGEYDVEAVGPPEAVLLYVVDQRYSSAVKHLAFALNQPKGWLSRAIEPLGATARAVGLGTPATLAALGLSITADDRDTMAKAIAQARTLISELAQAPPSSLPSARPKPKPTPRDRLVELLPGSSISAASGTPREAGVQELITEGLTERRLFVVRPLTFPPSAEPSVSH
jgi:hypothetical protein